MFIKLKQMSEKIVPPLIEQVTLRQKEIDKLTEDNKTLQKNLKMLHAIIRSPKLCDIYSKQEQRLMTQQQIAKANHEAYLKLRQC